MLRQGLADMSAFQLLPFRKLARTAIATSKKQSEVGLFLEGIEQSLLNDSFVLGFGLEY